MDFFKDALFLRRKIAVYMVVRFEKTGIKTEHAEKIGRFLKKPDFKKYEKNVPKIDYF